MRGLLTLTLHSYPWRHQLICLAPLACALLLTALCIGGGTALTRYFLAVQSNWPRLDAVVLFFSNNTHYAFYAVYALLLAKGLLDKNRQLTRRVLVALGAYLFVSLFLLKLIKIGVGMPRPLTVLDGGLLTPFSLDGAYHSFPSGHTTRIAALTAPLVIWLRRPLFSLLMGGIVALVGFSRIFLTMHHLSDIAGGMCLGILAGLIVHYYRIREES